MTYHEYKLLHQFFAMCTFALGWLVLVADNPKPFFRAFNLAFFLVGMVGFLLLHNFGIQVSTGLPFWIWAKIGLSAGLYSLVCAAYFYLKKKAKYLQFPYMAVLIVILYFGVFKID